MPEISIARIKDAHKEVLRNIKNDLRVIKSFIGNFDDNLVIVLDALYLPARQK